MTEDPEPGRPDEQPHQDEQRGQGERPADADADADAGCTFAAGPTDAPPGYGTMPPPPYGGGTYGSYGPYGGYGAYGGYGSPPAPKPGLIPLRPLTLGEILDGAFTAMRWNPKTILTASAVVATVSGVLLGLLTYIVQREVFASVSVPASGGTVSMTQVGNLLIASFILTGVASVVVFFSNTILTGLLTVAIGQGVLGQKETLGSVWRATRPRLWALFGMVLLSAMFLAGGWLLAVGLSVGAGVLLGAGAHLPAVGVFAGVLGGITATVFAVIVAVRWALAIPAVMLENAGPLAGLGRSWRLVRRSSWRVLGVLLLTELIVGIANMVIKMPFGLANGVSAFSLSSQPHVSVASVIISAIGTIVAATVTAPLFAGVVVLLYTDLRMRREGMDITLQAAAAGEPSGGEGADGRNPGPW